MNISLLKDTDRNNWTSKHPLQSWEWGEVKKQSGVTTLRFIARESKQNRCFTITLHPIVLNATMAYCARSEWPSESELHEIVPYLRSYGAIALKFEPDIWIQQSGEYHIPLIYKKWHRGVIAYTRSNATVFAKHTFVVDLVPDENQLLLRMKQKTRYNIRIAQKHGVIVRDISADPHGFDIFYSLYEDTLKRQRYLGHGKSYHKIVWETMKKAGHSKLFAAFYNNIPLAAYHMMYDSERAFYVYGGTSTQHKEVMASNVLMWEVIRDAKKLGKTYFDMWGALDKHHDPHDPWAGFHRFKEGYGGRHMTFMPTIDVVIRPLWYKIFSFSWPIRNKLLELKSALQAYHV